MEFTEVVRVFPCARHAGYVALSTEAVLQVSDFARHTGNFTRESVELVDHGVERFLELENLASHVHG